MENKSRRNRMKLCLGALFVLFVSTSDLSAQSPEQRLSVLRHIAETDYHPTLSAIAARLKLGVRTKEALDQLDKLLSREYGDMFWMYGCAGLYFSAKDELPESY